MKKIKGALLFFSNQIWTKVIMVMSIIMFALFIMGFLLNGFCGYNFDLGSIWTGISAIFGGGVVVFGTYLVDSLYNSPSGEPPKERNNVR